MRTTAGVATSVALTAAAVIAYTGFEALARSTSWPDRASEIEGVVNYHRTSPAMLTRDHGPGPFQYSVAPPVGGDHKLTWQNCMGDVYDAPIADEHAVHSLEHGAVCSPIGPTCPPPRSSEWRTGCVAATTS